jgi:hypothetical protein
MIWDIVIGLFIFFVVLPIALQLLVWAVVIIFGILAVIWEALSS